MASASCSANGTDDVLLEFGLDRVEPVAFGDIDMHTQDAFLFAAGDGEDLVRLESVDVAFKFIIRFVDGFFIGGVGDLFHADFAKLERLFAGHSADVGIVADGFGDDVARALQGFFDVGHLVVEEFRGEFFG